MKSSNIDTKPWQRNLVWTEVPQGQQNSEMFCDIVLNLSYTIYSTATLTRHRHRCCI